MDLFHPLFTLNGSQTSRYQAKVDTIERAKKENDAKKTRNLQKMDSEKEKYDELVKTVIIAQKKTLAKSATVHRLALCAYWSSNAAHVQIQQRSMERTAAFARASEDELASLDISSLDIGDSAALAASPEVPTTTPPAVSPVSSPDSAAAAKSELAAM